MEKIKKSANGILPFAGLIFVVVILGIGSKGTLFRVDNLTNILDQCYTIVLLSVGCSFIYAHGGFDLAVGGVYGLASMLSGMYILSSGLTWPAIGICIAVAMVLNLIVAVITTKLKLPAFITSLCMQFLCRGAITTFSGNSLSLPATVTVANNWTLKIIVLVVLLGGSYIIMSHTPLGRNNSAIGENPVAARQSGIDVDKTRILAYLIAGVLIGVAGFFAMCRSRSVATLVGAGYEMDVIVAIVLGGMSLNGGLKSSVRAPIIGALIVVLLTNGLVLIGVHFKYADAIIGLVFLVVIVLSYKRNKLGLLPR